MKMSDTPKTVIAEAAMIRSRHIAPYRSSKARKLCRV